MKTRPEVLQLHICTLLQTRPFVEVSTLHSEAIKGMEGVKIETNGTSLIITSNHPQG